MQDMIALVAGGAPIGCMDHFVPTLDPTLSRLRFVEFLSRQVPVEQRLSSWLRVTESGWGRRHATKCSDLRVQLLFQG